MAPVAEAICEAVIRANMRFVATKTPEQQSGLVLHRTRHLFIRQQTAVINAIRAHLAARLRDRGGLSYAHVRLNFRGLWRARRRSRRPRRVSPGMVRAGGRESTPKLPRGPLASRRFREQEVTTATRTFRPRIKTQSVKYAPETAAKAT